MSTRAPTQISAMTGSRTSCHLPSEDLIEHLVGCRVVDMICEQNSNGRDRLKL